MPNQKRSLSIAPHSANPHLMEFARAFPGGAVCVIPPRRRLSRPDPTRVKSERHPSRTTDQVRLGTQSQDRHGAQPDNSTGVLAIADEVIEQACFCCTAYVCFWQILLQKSPKRKAPLAPS